MLNRKININSLVELANVLNSFEAKFVFVGGAVLELYTDDPASEEVRITTDIDLTIEVTGYADLSKIEGALYTKGFIPDPEGNTTHSYLWHGLKIDLIPSNEQIIGFSNRWYKSGITKAVELHILSSKLLILPFAYFLASKLEAFNDRGKGEYRTSHDFEDIIFIINNNSKAVEEVLSSQPDVKNFIQSEFKKLLDNKHVEEYISAHLSPAGASNRYPIVHQKITSIVSGNT